MSLPGGVCGSRGCDPCDGACIDTPRLGALCLAGCTADRDCRADEGYVCERGACTLPNLAVITPQTCAGPDTRDHAFGAQEQLGFGEQPSAIAAKPFVAMWQSSRGIELANTQTAFAAIGHDVVLARDRSTLFAAWRDSEAIELSTSTDDGATWSSPHPAQANDGSELGRPMLAAGTRALF
ncbi:MAG TPA: hypothetical protein VGC41_16020, partial [Kofleriaceae bacterium]